LRNLLQTKEQEAEEDDSEYPVPFSERAKCFEFNKTLDDMLEDYGCDHCTKYLTLQCPFISKFLEDFNGNDE
jgi:hypothetical protein